MTATTRIVGCLSASNVDSKALQNENSFSQVTLSVEYQEEQGRQAWRW